MEQRALVKPDRRFGKEPPEEPQKKESGEMISGQLPSMHGHERPQDGETPPWHHARW